jgi:uroporphyrinogen-III synthase
MTRSAGHNALAAQGLDAVVLPLMEIAPVRTMRAAVQRLSDYRAVMFVSGNAVSHFLHDALLPFASRAWAPGPGTRDALLDAGVDASLIDAPHGLTPRSLIPNHCGSR